MTLTNRGYYNDFERVRFTPQPSRLQWGLWWLCHGLLGISCGGLRPGWLLSAVIVTGLLCHAWCRRPRPPLPFQLGRDGDFWLPALSLDAYQLRQAELGPWHVYLVLEAAGSVVRLCIYKDALEASAWAALRRRLLATNNIGKPEQRC